MGTGLGLSYAKMLAQSHNGDLYYTDAVGGGSNFQLILPISETEKNEVRRVKEQENKVKNEEVRDDRVELLDDSSDQKGSSQKTNHCILLVEDNEELLQMTSDALRSYFRIIKAHDGVEALDLLKYNDVDVIVTDVMMPRMDGNELCRQLKGDINFSHIPVIMLTAKTSVEAKVEGMESGADIYLEKPFSIKQLHL